MKRNLFKKAVSFTVFTLLLMLMLSTPALVHAGNITGHVTDNTGAPVTYLTVTAVLVTTSISPYCDNSTTKSTITDYLGNYTFTADPLPAGNYKIQFGGGASNPFATNYAPQWYNNVTTEALASIIPVTASGTVSNINAIMLPGASISGTVTGTGGVPLEGIQVSAGTATDLLASAITDASGNYELSNLAPGTYTLSFSESPYASPRVPAPATMYAPKDFPSQITVSGSTAYTGKNIQLSLGGTITGTISPTTAQVQISVTSSVIQGLITSGNSDNTNGTFAVGGIPTGTFTVTLTDQSGRYIPVELTNISVTAGQATNLGATTLQQGGRINGMVRNTSQTPLPNIFEVAYDAATGAPAGFAISYPDGSYSIGGLKTGSYKVQFLSCDGGYNTQWYNGQTTQGAATPVPVSAPNPVFGIDGTLNIVVPTTYQLTVVYSGSGSGSVNSSPAGINCISSACSPASFSAGSSVSIVATPDQNSSFAGWSGCDSTSTTNVAGDTCAIAMNAANTVTTTFNALPARVLILGSPTPYQLMQQAYDATVDNDILQPLAEVFAEDPLTFRHAVNIVLAGGYDAGFLNQTGFTTIQGQVIFQLGSVVVDRLAIR